MTFWVGGAASTAWRAIPIVGTGDTLLGTSATAYTGTADFDTNHAPVALDSALLAAAKPAATLAALAYPTSFTPSTGVPQSTPGALIWGSGAANSGVGIPWDENTFSGFDPTEIAPTIRERLLAANQFWLSLMGFGASLRTADAGTAATAPYALPNTASAIVVIKEFSPRIRVFRRSPT